MISSGFCYYLVRQRKYYTCLLYTSNWFGDYTEVGLGLCCEEAERLLFSDSKPLTFVEEVTQDEDDELSEEMWHEAEDVCPTADEEQDYSDEDEHTDSSDLLDDESEECEQMLEERKAIFSILQKRKKNIGARLKRLLLQLPYADEMLLLTVPILEWDDPESIPKLSLIHISSRAIQSFIWQAIWSGSMCCQRWHRR